MATLNFPLAHPGPHRLLVKGQEPFNAEPDLAALVEPQYTPTVLVYCRNHSVLPELNAETYTVKVEGLVERELAYKLAELEECFPRVEVIATLQCAGNRRQKMVDKKQKDVQGIKWGESVIANVPWAGVRLRDLLLRAGVRSGPHIDKLHVCFGSHVTKCQDDKDYSVSIPLRKALDPDGDVLLAYEMNGRPLTPSHGYPFRIVVPGYTGARWVKWVDTITVSAQECSNFYQSKDYRILPANVESRAMADKEDWWSRVPALQAIPLNSVIASAQLRRPAAADTQQQHAVYLVKGYAVSGLTPVAHVEVSADSGRTWAPARITYREGRWSWVLWEVELAIAPPAGAPQGRALVGIWSRAVDENLVRQPLECEWNLRGVAYDGVGEFEIRV